MQYSRFTDPERSSGGKIKRVARADATAVKIETADHDQFGHPLFSYLPDGDLTGLVLDFDVTWQGIQSCESLKNAWTDWNTLDCTVSGVGQKVTWVRHQRYHDHLQPARLPPTRSI